MFLQYYLQKSGPPTFPVQVDFAAYLEYLGGVNLDGVLDIEFLQNIAVDTSTVLEYLGTIPSTTFTSYLEWLATIDGDYIIPIEYLGNNAEPYPIGLLKWTIANRRKIWISTRSTTWTLV